MIETLLGMASTCSRASTRDRARGSGCRAAWSSAPLAGRPHAPPSLSGRGPAWWSVRRKVGQPWRCPARHGMARAGTLSAPPGSGDAGDTLLLDAMTAAIKRLVARGKERGYVTLDELNSALTREQASSEMVEDTMAMLNDIGIHVAEGGGPEDGEAAVVGPRRPLSPLLPRSGAEASLDGSDARCGDATGWAR